MKKFNRIISNDTIFVIIIFITGLNILNSVRHFPDAIIENNKLKDLLIKEKDEISFSNSSALLPLLYDVTWNPSISKFIWINSDKLFSSSTKHIFCITKLFLN